MTSEDTPARQGNKTAEILKAAKAHFAAHGFEATKLSDVARDADVAVGTIYLRYKSKSDLLAGVLEFVEASFCAAMDAPALWAKPFPDRFAAIMKSVIDQALGEADLGRLMALVPFASQHNASPRNTVRAMIARHLNDGVERGELRADMDVALVAQLAHGMVEGAMAELMTNPKRASDDVIKELAFASSRWLGTA